MSIKQTISQDLLPLRKLMHSGKLLIIAGLCSGLVACGGGGGGSGSSSSPSDAPTADATEPTTTDNGEPPLAESRVVPAPSNLKATETNSIVRLTWAPSMGATSYTVYYRSNNNAEQQATTTDTHFEHLTFSGAETWTYEVIAQGATADNSSEPSVAYRLEMAPVHAASDVGI